MDFASRTLNLTPMEVRCLPVEDRHGRSLCVAVAKITYDVSPTGVARLSKHPSPIRTGDEPNDGSPFASTRFPHDYEGEKPGTDVIVVGTAFPPDGQPVSDMLVSVRVGHLFKAIRVFGARVYQLRVLGGVEPGPAQRLGPTPIRYELAFGGTDEIDGRRVAHPRHPLGMGFAEARRKLAGAAAHRLEVDARALDKSREPAGFGAIDPHWSPRLELIGSRDLEWQRSRAPLPPLDFDPRHACAAHPDLHSDAPLSPDEPVEIIGMTPEGVWRFRLPKVSPIFSSTMRGEERPHETHLDTFIIDADEGRVELVFRAAIPLPKKAQLLERVTVRATGELSPVTLSEAS
jgi:hypothetical protein